MGISPGDFTSSIDTGLPQLPETVEEPTREDLIAVFNAVKTLQMQIETILARLAAAGIP